MPKVKWQIIGEDKSNGGLGVIDVEGQAAALMARTLTPLLHRQNHNRSFAHELIEGIVRQHLKVDSIAILMMEPSSFMRKLKSYPFLWSLVENLLTLHPSREHRRLPRDSLETHSDIALRHQRRCPCPIYESKISLPISEVPRWWRMDSDQMHQDVAKGRRQK